MKPLLCGLLFLSLGHTAQANEIPNDRLVRYCNAILLQDAGFGPDYPPGVSAQQLAPNARHYFTTRTSTQKKRELQRVARLPLSSQAAQSVAYVAALSGIEPYNNVRRMLGKDNAPDPSHPLYPELAGAAEMIYGNVSKVYQRFPDRRIALLLLQERSDGAGATVARSTRFGMLKRQPRFMLGLAMQSKQAFQTINHDFSEDGSEEEFSVLRRLCNDRDPILRRGANQIRRNIHTYRSKYQIR